jgi:hypothetical protein
VARPVYSALFFRAPAASGGPTLAYTVPAGFLAVVRTMSVVWGDVTISGLDAWVQTEDLAKLCRVTLATGLSGTTIGGCSIFNGHWAVEPAETLSVQTASGTCDFTCSGYLLTLP